jgi:hypothetical protein
MTWKTNVYVMLMEHCVYKTLAMESAPPSQRIVYSPLTVQWVKMIVVVLIGV